VQRKTDLPFDTNRGLARRVVVEARVFFLEVQLDHARRAVALLPDDHLGDAFDALVGLGVDRAVVKLLPVDETDDVGVLLDRSRLAKIGELRSPVLTAALFGGARELGDCDDGDIQLFRQRFERARDVGNLLLAVLDVTRPCISCR